MVLPQSEILMKIKVSAAPSVAKLCRGNAASMDRKRFHTLYAAPLIHLTLYVAMWGSALTPRLGFLGLLGSVLMLIDLPFVSFGALALSFHYPLLANIVEAVGGTLWWYFLSWLLFRFTNRKVQSIPQS
jgi:hypothetical protein